MLNENLVLKLPNSLQLNQSRVQSISSWDSYKQNSLYCRVRTENKSIVFCSGTILVQEYKPSNFGFSFSFKCSMQYDKPSLKGLHFNVTVHSQSNITECVEVENLSIRQKCNTRYTSLPNLFGFMTMEQIVRAMETLQNARALLTLQNTNLNPFGCYQNIDDGICHLLIPSCNPQTREVTHLCEEMCLDFLEACNQDVVSVIESLASGRFFEVPFESHLPIGAEEARLVCGGLPSKENHKCFFKQSVCGPPPLVLSATRVREERCGQNNQSNKFPQNCTIYYKCVEDTYLLENKSNITCQFSGKWTKPPTCLFPTKNPVPIVVVILLLPSVIFIIIFCFSQMMYYQGPQRNEDFDAFVCYQFDASHDYVTNILKPHLEGQFKLLDFNDFDPGTRIVNNMENAIKRSNTAIIILSDKFVDSAVCRQEFDFCFMEIYNDPAFKLLVILTQPVQDYRNLDEPTSATIRLLYIFTMTTP